VHKGVWKRVPPDALNFKLLSFNYLPCFSASAFTFASTCFLWSGYQNQRTSASKPKPTAGINVEILKIPVNTDSVCFKPSAAAFEF
jgi:hypothetical protein